MERAGHNPFGMGPAGPVYDPTNVEAAAADLTRAVKDEWRSRLLAAHVEASNITRVLDVLDRLLPLVLTLL